MRDDSIVIAYHPRAREVGYSILNRGGNAADAFVAVVAAENVLAEGASTLAGPLGALYYERRSGVTVYLDADFNDPCDPNWKWKARLPVGQTWLVPGAPAGLEGMIKRFGTLPLALALQPAAELAEEGFPVTNLMAVFLKIRARTLRKTVYGLETYMDSNGRPRPAGTMLRLPEVGAFLRMLGTEGARHVYEGAWGQQFLTTVKEAGGILKNEDLHHYAVRWEEPWSIRWQDCTVFSCSGRSYGGLWGLLALNAVCHANLPHQQHYSTDPVSLSTLVRIARHVWGESWILDEEALDDRQLVLSRLKQDYARAIWQRARDAETFHGIKRPGTHSYPILVVDKEGNAVLGTTTIEAEPWGSGVFVQGVPLSPAGAIPWNTSAGCRRISPFSMHLVLSEGQVRFGTCGISNSAVETSFQVLLNLMHYRLDIQNAVTRARFGTFPYRRKLDFKRNWLNPTISRTTVAEAQKLGVKFKRRGVIDTGLGAALSVQEGKLSGAVAPLPYIRDPFKATGK